MRITLESILSDGGYEALCKCCDQERTGKLLLTLIRFPPSRRPVFSSAGDFWQDVLSEIDRGVLDHDGVEDGTDENGFTRLFAAAAQLYPTNSYFKRFRQERHPDIHVIVRGWEDTADLLRRAKEIADELSLPPDSVGLANRDFIVLALKGCRDEQGEAFAIQLASEGGPHIRVSSHTCQR